MGCGAAQSFGHVDRREQPRAVAHRHHVLVLRVGRADRIRRLGGRLLPRGEHGRRRGGQGEHGGNGEEAGAHRRECSAGVRACHGSAPGVRAPASLAARGRGVRSRVPAWRRSPTRSPPRCRRACRRAGRRHADGSIQRVELQGVTSPETPPPRARVAVRAPALPPRSRLEGGGVGCAGSGGRARRRRSSGGRHTGRRNRRGLRRRR